MITFKFPLRIFVILVTQNDLIFAIAAVLTPPDPITQIGLALPLLLLYELSIVTVKLIEKRN